MLGTCPPGKEWGKASGLPLSMLAEEKLIAEAPSASQRKAIHLMWGQVTVSDVYPAPPPQLP